VCFLVEGVPAEDSNSRLASTTARMDHLLTNGFGLNPSFRLAGGWRNLRCRSSKIANMSQEENEYLQERAKRLLRLLEEVMKSPRRASFVPELPETLPGTPLKVSDSRPS
jgi:hypothetical protein